MCELVPAERQPGTNSRRRMLYFLAVYNIIQHCQMKLTVRVYLHHSIVFWGHKHLNMGAYISDQVSLFDWTILHPFLIRSGSWVSFSTDAERSPHPVLSTPTLVDRIPTVQRLHPPPPPLSVIHHRQFAWDWRSKGTINCTKNIKRSRMPTRR